MRVGLGPTLGKKSDFPLADGLSGTFDLRVPQKPLLTQIWLYWDVGAIPIAYIVGVVLGLDEEFLISELPDDGFACRKAVQSDKIRARLRSHFSVLPDHDG